MSGEMKLAAGKSVDDWMIELAALDLSPEEISRRMGGIVTPARVMFRTRELLKSGDWLTDAQKEQANLRLLQNTLAKLRDEQFSLDNAKVQLSFIKEILARLDVRRATTNDQLNTYNANVGRQLGAVVDRALSYMQGALRDEIDPVRWGELVQEAMMIAWTDIKSKQVEE